MAPTNPAQPKSGYNNIKVGYIVPSVDADGINIANDPTYPALGSVFANFDTINSAFKVNTINEYTAASGVTLDSTLLKDGGVRLANNANLQGRNNANNADIDILKINTSDKLQSSSTLDLHWQTFTPSAYGGTGSLTFTSVTESQNHYFLLGDMLIVHFRATGTTGGTTSTELTWTLPGGMTTNINYELGCTVFENSGNSKPGRCYAVSSTQFRVSKYDVSNFVLAANTGFIVQGVLRLA